MYYTRYVTLYTNLYLECIFNLLYYFFLDLLKILCNILMTIGIPAEILTEVKNNAISSMIHWIIDIYFRVW